MVDSQPAWSDIDRRESAAAIVYFAAYLAFSFVTPGSEARHYLTLVLFPLAIVVWARALGRRSSSPSSILASFGLRRGNLRTGLVWALALGLLLGVFQLSQRQAGPELWALIRNGKALYLFPIAAAFGFLTAGFTEEFFFRGFLQTRIERLSGRPWVAMVLAAIAFGLYHVPYAYLNPNWPTAGNLGAAFSTGMTEGLLGGLILGAGYVLWKKNLLACIVLHGMIDAVPIMTLIRFGGAGSG